MKLRIDIVGTITRLKSVLDKGKSMLKSFTSSISNAFNSKLGRLASGVGIALLLRNIYNNSKQFSRGMAEVNTIARLSRTEFNKLKEDTKNLASELGLELPTVVKSLYQALSAGVPSDNVISFMREAGKAAIGGATDIETAVDGLTSVLNAYGFSTKDTARIADVFFETIRLGKTTFPELSQSLGQVVTLANTAGVSFEEVGAALASMTKRGLGTDLAVTQLKGVIKAMIKPSEELRSVMKNLTSQYGEAKFASLSLQKKLDLITKSVGNNKEEIAKLFPDIRGLNGALTLTGDNASSVALDLDQLSNSAGAAQRAFNTMMEDDPSRQIDKFAESIRESAVSIGQVMLPKIAELTKSLADIAKAAKDAEKALDIEAAAGVSTKNKDRGFFRNVLWALYGYDDEIHLSAPTAKEIKNKKTQNKKILDSTKISTSQISTDLKAKEKSLKQEEKAKKNIKEQLEALNQKLKIQNLINAGKDKEAFIEEEMQAARKAAGRDLTSEEEAKIFLGASSLYAAQNKRKPQYMESRAMNIERIGGSVAGIKPMKTQENLMRKSNDYLDRIERNTDTIMENSKKKGNLAR